jgi:hypothetical protein
MLRRLVAKGRWWIGMTLSLSVALILFRSRPSPKVTRGITDPAAMKAAVRHAILPNSTITQAETFMQQEGFQRLRFTNQDFTEQERIFHRINYLYCARSDIARWPITRRWQIALVHSNNTIIDALVSCYLVGP